MKESARNISLITRPSVNLQFAANSGEPIRAETVQHEKKADKGGIVDGSDAAERIFARSERRISHRPDGRPSGRSVGRSGSLTRTVADPSVDYSGDLTWTWKQVLGIRFSILHTTLINAARLLHRIGTYAAYGALDALARSHALPRYSLRCNVRCLFDCISTGRSLKI